MAEALVAFSAAGNALQFAQLGMKLLTKTIEYTRGGGCLEYQALMEVTQGLLVSNDNLRVSLEAKMNQISKHGPARALYMANKRCLDVSMEAFTLLRQLELNQSGRNVWQSLKLAVKGIYNKERFREINEQIEAARANLLVSLMVHLHTDQQTYSQILKDMKDENKVIVRELEKISLGNDNLRGGVNGLARRLANGDDDLKQMKTLGKEIMVDQSAVASVDKLFMLISNMEENLLPLAEKLRQTESLLENELRARHQIMQSIMPKAMYDRRDHIRSAYLGTFEWLFIPKDGEYGPCDEFLQWLGGHGEQKIFWIFGKPGSGKSTLMRELDQRLNYYVGKDGISFDLKPDAQKPDVAENHERPPNYKSNRETEHDNVMEKLRLGSSSFRGALSDWLGSKELFRTWSYFWFAGTSEQKSISGFIRGLVYQIMEHRPDLIDETIPIDRWEQAILGQPYMQALHDHEILDILEKSMDQLSETTKFLLLIDGLDEFDGPEEEKGALLDLVFRLTEKSNVKACVASRPWNIFRDAFGDCPQLQLENLTQEDIMVYVRGSLLSDKNFKRKTLKESDLLPRVATDITRKAQGVFLWVYLAIRDLLTILRDGCNTRQLFGELNRMPPGLNQYFELITRRIDVRYKHEAAMLLLAIVYPMVVREETADSHEISCQIWRLYYMDYIEEGLDKYFAISLNAIDLPVFESRIEYREADSDDEGDGEEAAELIDLYRRRLMSRSMGLLEVNISTKAQSKLACGMKRVNFFHRTLRDYLTTNDAQKLLKECLNDDFDVLLFRCNLLLVEILTWLRRGKCDFDQVLSNITCLVWQLLALGPTEPVFDFVEKLATIMADHGQRLLIHVQRKATKTRCVPHEDIGSHDSTEFYFERTNSTSQEFDVLPSLQTRLTSATSELRQARTTTALLKRVNDASWMKGDSKLSETLSDIPQQDVPVTNLENILHKWVCEGSSTIQLGLKLRLADCDTYIKRKVSPDSIRANTQCPLLSQALGTSYRDDVAGRWWTGGPDVKVLDALFQKGASPDDFTGTIKRVPTWVQFFLSIPLIRDRNHDLCSEAVHLFLANKIRSRAAGSVILAALDNLADGKAYSSGGSSWSLTSHRRALQAQLGNLKPTHRDPGEDPEPKYTPTQILSCLETMDRFGTKCPLFSRDELDFFVDIYHNCM